MLLATGICDMPFPDEGEPLVTGRGKVRINVSSARRSSHDVHACALAMSQADVEDCAAVARYLLSLDVDEAMVRSIPVSDIKLTRAGVAARELCFRPFV